MAVCDRVLSVSRNIGENDPAQNKGYEEKWCLS